MAVTASTLGIITAIGTIGGLGMSMVSSVMQARQQQAAYEAQAEGQRRAYMEQAEAARRNRQVAEDNALATERAGAWEVEKARLKALRLEGSQKVGYAKAGVLLEGSPLDVMAETAANEELDILATQYNYDVQAARYRSQGDFYGFEAGRQERLAASQPETPNFMQQGLMKAGTSLLTTVGDWGKTKVGRTTYDPNIPGSGWGVSYDLW
jgi:hypothetical protein